MYSLSSPKFRRCLVISVGLALLIAAATSCSHHADPPVPKPVTAPRLSAASKPRPIAVRPKTLLPVAFPNLDTGQISSLQFSPDGRRLAFGYGADAEVSVWDMETGRMDWQRSMTGASGGPLMFDPKGRMMLVQCYDPDSDLPLWVCTTGGHLLRKLPTYLTGQAWFERSGEFLVAAGHPNDWRRNGNPWGNKFIEVYDTRTWRRVDRLAVEPKGPVPLTASGHIIRGTRHFNGSYLLMKDGQPTGKWWKPMPVSWLGDECTATRGRYFVDARGNHNDKGLIEGWDLRRKTRRWAFAMKGDAPRTITISPEGRMFAVGSIGGSVEFRALATGHLIHRTHCSTDVIRCLAFSPNERVLAAAGDLEQQRNGQSDGVRLLDCSSYTLLAVLKVAFPENSGPAKDWTLHHPDWFASLPNLSYIASDSVVKKIRMPGKARDVGFIGRFYRPQRVRDALRACYQRS